MDKWTFEELSALRQELNAIWQILDNNKLLPKEKDEKEESDK